MMEQQGQQQDSQEHGHHPQVVPSSVGASSVRVPVANPRSKSRPFLACTHCHSARTACAEQRPDHKQRQKDTMEMNDAYSYGHLPPPLSHSEYLLFLCLCMLQINCGRPCPRCTRYGYQCIPRTRAKYGSFGAAASSSAESVAQLPDPMISSTPRYIPSTPSSIPFIPRGGGGGGETMSPDWLQQWQRQLQSEMEMINAIQRRLEPSPAASQNMSLPTTMNEPYRNMTSQLNSQDNSYVTVDPRYEFSHRPRPDMQFQNSMPSRHGPVAQPQQQQQQQQFQQSQMEYQPAPASNWQPSYQPPPPPPVTHIPAPSFLIPDDHARSNNMSSQFPISDAFTPHQLQDGPEAFGGLYPLAQDPLAQMPLVQDHEPSISDRSMIASSNRQFSPTEAFNPDWNNLPPSFPEVHDEFHFRDQPEYMGGTDDATSSSSFPTPFSPTNHHHHHPTHEKSFGSHLEVPSMDDDSSGRHRSGSHGPVDLDSDPQPYSHEVLAFAAEQLYQVDSALADGTMTLSRARMIISSIFFPLWSESEQQELLQMFDALKKSRRPSHGGGESAAREAAAAAVAARLQAAQLPEDSPESIVTSRKKRRLQPDGSSLPDSGSEVSSSASSVRHIIKSHPVSDNAVRELIQLWRKQYCPAPLTGPPSPRQLSPSPEPSPASLMLAALSFSFSPLTAYTDDTDDVPRMRISHLGVQWVNIDTIVKGGTALPPAVAVAMPPVRTSCIGGAAPIMLATAPRCRYRPKSRRYRTKEEEEAEWLTDQERYLQQQLQKLAIVSSDAQQSAATVSSSSTSSSSSAASSFPVPSNLTSGATSALVECLTLQVNSAWERETGWSQAEQRAACLKYGRLGYWKLNMRPDYIEAGAREFWSYQLQTANALDNPKLATNSIEDGEDDSDNASTYSSSSSSTLHPKIPPLDMIVVMVAKDGTERLRHLIWQPSNIIIDGSFQSTVHIIQPLTSKEKEELIIPKYGDVITHEDIIYGRRRGRGFRLARPF